MVASSGFCYKLFLIFLAEFPLSFCNIADFNRAYVQNVNDRQSSEKRPSNIFAVFDEIIDNKVEDPLNNPKYRDILDRADGIPNIKRPKRFFTAESPQELFKHEVPFYKTNNAFSSPIDDASSTSSSETDGNDGDFEQGVFVPKSDQQVNVVDRILTDYKNNDAMSLKDENGVEDLLLAARTSCFKAASKACKKACKKALKGVCEEYKCHSDLKKRFKSECNRNCNTRFSVSKD